MFSVRPWWGLGCRRGSLSVFEGTWGLYSLFPSLFWRRLPLPWWALFRLGFGFEVVGWLLALWLRGSFLLRPPRARRLVFWSLRTVLGLLSSPWFCSSTSSFDLLRRALFWWSRRLVSALLCSLSCSDVCLAGILFGRSSGLSGPVSGVFLAWSVRLGHLFSPCLLRAGLVASACQPLCPVGALRVYVWAPS